MKWPQWTESPRTESSGEQPESSTNQRPMCCYSWLTISYISAKKNQKSNIYRENQQWLSSKHVWVFKKGTVGTFRPKRCVISSLLRHFLCLKQPFLQFSGDVSSTEITHINFKKSVPSNLVFSALPNCQILFLSNWFFAFFFTSHPPTSRMWLLK